MPGQAAQPQINTASAKVLVDQAKYLLDDEIRYADSLKSTRRSLGALLLALIGLGLIKVDLFASPEEVLIVSPWGLWVIRIISVAAACSMVIAFYWLYTERPALFIGRQAKHARQTKVQRDHGKGAALSVLDLDSDWRRKLEKAEDAIVQAAYARGLAIAYERLSAANRRVRYRIEVGKRWVFAGFLLLLASLGLYTWSITSPS